MKGKILIVEDEVLIYKDLEIILSGAGYEVMESVTTAEEAIQKALDVKPDLILMDIMLQGKKNGIQAVSEIRKKMDVPIIFITAYASENFIAEAASYGSYAYIVKPFKEEHVKTAVRLALQKASFQKRIKSKLQEIENISLQDLQDKRKLSKLKEEVSHVNSLIRKYEKELMLYIDPQNSH